MLARSHRRRVLVLAFVLGAAVFAASASATPRTHAAKPTVHRFWTSAEVNARLPTRHIKLVWNVPKKLPKHYTLGFLNWSVAYPFFNEWSKGMIAASKLFGVSFYQADAAFDTSKFLSLYQQLEVNHLDALGMGAQAPLVVVQAATSNGVKVVTIDAPVAGAAGIGIDNKPAGRLAGNFLGAAAKAKLKGPWKGSKILYIGLTGSGCAACDDRVNAAEATIKKYVPLAGASITIGSTNDETQRIVADLITSHPGWKFLLTSYGDEPPAAAVPAFQATNNMSNVLVVTMGGDLAGRTLLRKYPATVIGAVDFNPFAEGFNWVVASLAFLNHQHFAQYPVTTVLTPATVNKLYPNDPASS